MSLNGEREVTSALKTHWEAIYKTKAPDAVSWYQECPEKSLELIAHSRIFKSSRIIDIGGGASNLVDHLLERNYLNVTVMDISDASLQIAQKRLGDKAAKATWIETDILQAEFAKEHFDLWHDRAVFHFLTNGEDRKRYLDQLSSAVKMGGHIIIATFALDGPERCSGLDVVRYSSDSLCNEIGERYELVETLTEDHATPFNTVQKFNYCLFRKKA